MIKLLTTRPNRKPFVAWYPRYWELEEDYLFIFDTINVGIRKGFRYDLSTIPALARGIIPIYSLSIAAPLAHDYLYRMGGIIPHPFFPGQNIQITRKEADKLFLAVMIHQEVNPVLRTIGYRSVRLFAGFAWKGGRNGKTRDSNTTN